MPKCALKGLELQDVMFNDVVNCGVSTNEDGNHFVWQIDYNDCGTTKSVSFIANEGHVSSHTRLSSIHHLV